MSNFELDAANLPPTLEIAHALARLGVVRRALESVEQLTRFHPGSSMDPNYPIEYTLASRYLVPSAAKRDPRYAHLQMHELWLAIPGLERPQGTTSPMQAVNEVLKAHRLKNSHDVNDRMQHIKKEGRLAALRRVGIVHEKSVLPGMRAAYAFGRADIHEAVDRRLYDQEAELSRESGRLLPLQAQLGRTSRYAIIAADWYTPTAPINFDGATDTPVNFWWQELSQELADLDERTA